MAESVKTGEPVGYKQGGVAKPKSEAEVRAEALAESLAKSEEENKLLRGKVAELEAKLAGAAVSMETLSSPRKGLDDAKMLDGIVNQ